MSVQLKSVGPVLLPYSPFPSFRKIKNEGRK